jgi:holo-[acyl-carrier protein] synthase
LAILGIGCDFIEISRIDKLIKKFGDHFIYRIFTDLEISTSCSFNESRKLQYFAKRFAAKEAFAKATGFGIGKMVGFKDINVINDAFGKPFIESDYLTDRNLQAHLSLSDDGQYALAYVILEKL